MTSFEQFLYTLPIMGKGMLSIFIVTGIIILFMSLLTRIKDKGE